MVGVCPGLRGRNLATGDRPHRSPDTHLCSVGQLTGNPEPTKFFQTPVLFDLVPREGRVLTIAWEGLSETDKPFLTLGSLALEEHEGHCSPGVTTTVQRRECRDGSPSWSGRGTTYTTTNII